MIRFLAVFPALVSTVAACSQALPVLDPCAGVDCRGHGDCVEIAGSPYCECHAGYHPESLTCVVNDLNDPCDGVLCSGHGECRVERDFPRCICNPGYASDDSGLHCFAAGEPPTDAGPDADTDVEVEPGCDGEELWSDDFGDGTLATEYEIVRWGVNSERVEWVEEDGALRYQGADRSGGSESAVLVGEESWSSIRIETTVTITEMSPNSTHGLVVRYRSPEEYYALTLGGPSAGLFLLRGLVDTMDQYPMIVRVDTPYHLALEDHGDLLRGFVNGDLTLEVDLDNPPTPGRAGILGCQGTASFEALRMSRCE